MSWNARITRARAERPCAGSEPPRRPRPAAAAIRRRASTSARP